MILSVAITQNCPLTCVSCPTGRREIRQNANQMGLGEFERLCEKVAADRSIRSIWICGWHEPMLHDCLPEFITIAKRYAPFVATSTTGMIHRNIERLVKSEPNHIAVSISGWTNETHRTTHGRGDIDTVKLFLCRLNALGAKGVSVTYHRYSNNLHEEADARAFCRVRGFGFYAPWATHQGVEDLIQGGGNEYLAVSIPEQLHATRFVRLDNCSLQRRLDVTATGAVLNCCASKTELPANIFHDDMERIWALKRQSALCGNCMQARVHKIACGRSVEVDRLAAKRFGDRIRWRWERFKKRIWIAKETRN